MSVLYMVQSFASTGLHQRLKNGRLDPQPTSRKLSSTAVHQETLALLATFVVRLFGNTSTTVRIATACFCSASFMGLPGSYLPLVELFQQTVADVGGRDTSGSSAGRVNICIILRMCLHLHSAVLK